jgi:post-segregation antitoxin (ccd killing protein)
MSGRNVNIYLPEETYNKIKDLIKQRKVSKFVSEAIEEKLDKEEKEQGKEELEQT